MKIPNSRTRQTLAKSKLGKDVKDFATVDELFKDLEQPAHAKPSPKGPKGEQQ